MARGRFAEVCLIKTPDRDIGVRSLLTQISLNDYSGKTVALKANFNSADPFPASTHLDTLSVLVENFKKYKAGDLVLAERSGMGNTRTVLQRMGVFKLSEKLGFKVVVLDEEDKDGWIKIDGDGTHWPNGFHVSKVFLDADKVVQTCCLKTHRFGGHFTLSLKNSVGLVAKNVPGEVHDYMRDLHGSPYQRLMVAEINKYYDVDLVVMDAIKAFVNEGPERGDVVTPNILLASKDRVAIDAVGIAILRSYGSTKNIMRGRIFELDQIRRATEIDIGVKSASDIKLTPINKESRDAAEKIKYILESQG
jgi:uncharacterized protein (DUF362 family)